MRSLIKRLLLKILHKKLAGNGAFPVRRSKYRKPKKRKGGLKHLLKKIFD